MLCYAVAVLCARLRQELCVATCCGCECDCCCGCGCGGGCGLSCGRLEQGPIAMLCYARLEQGPIATLCYAFDVLCAGLRQELGVALRCYALVYVVLGYGKGYVLLRNAMLCYATLCYAILC